MHSIPIEDQVSPRVRIVAVTPYHRELVAQLSKTCMKQVASSLKIH